MSWLRPHQFPTSESDVPLSWETLVRYRESLSRGFGRPTAHRYVQRRHTEDTSAGRVS